MSTSRVPGVTRNSGWRAVQAEIVDARGVREQQGLTVSAGAESQVDPAAEGPAGREGESAPPAGPR